MSGIVGSLEPIRFLESKRYTNEIRKTRGKQAKQITVEIIGSQLYFPWLDVCFLTAGNIAQCCPLPLVYRCHIVTT